MATVKKKELDTTPGKAFNQALNNSKLSKPAPPLNSKGQPVAQAPARSRAATMAPLKPMSFISQPAATKAAPVAKAAPKASAPVARTAAPMLGGPLSKGISNFGSAFAAARAKGDRAFEFGGKKYTTAQKGESGKQTTTALSKAYEKTTGLPQTVAQMAPKAITPTETQPMGKREVDLNISTKRGNLFQRMGERMKQRQLARASKSVGTPMKSTTSIPSTPVSSTPQREMNATDRLKMALQAKSAPQREMNSTDKLKMALQAQKSQPLSAAARGMLDKYMSKKYMGGGKMEYGMGGKMDKKKAFMEMIARLKAKKK